MASAVPITFKLEGQVSRFATKVVTAFGGGAKLLPWAIAAEIWRYLKNPKPPSSANTTTSIRTIRFSMIASRYRVAGGETSVGHRLKLNPRETKYHSFRNWMCEKLLWLQKMINIKMINMMRCGLLCGNLVAGLRRLKKTDGRVFEVAGQGGRSASIRTRR